AALAGVSSTPTRQRFLCAALAAIAVAKGETLVMAATTLTPGMAGMAVTADLAAGFVPPARLRWPPARSAATSAAAEAKAELATAVQVMAAVAAAAAMVAASSIRSVLPQLIYAVFWSLL